MIYFDDIILPEITFERLKKNLKIEFEIKDLGQNAIIFRKGSCKVKKGICVSQRKYVFDLLTKNIMLGC